MAFRRKFQNRKRKGLRKPSGKRSQYKLKPNFRKANTVGEVKRVVNSVLSRKVETKMQVYDWALSPLCLQATTGTLINNYIVLNPSNATGPSYNLGQGTDSAQFIGNQIYVKRCIVDYVHTLNNYNATTNSQMRPYYLRAYIFRQRRNPLNDPQVSNYCGTSTANFFGQGAYNIGFVGQLSDLNSKINKEAYIYCAHKTWKLGNQIPMVGSSPGAPFYTQSNNDFKMSALGKWDVTKYLPKKPTRDDVNPSPIWQQPYVIMMFQVLAADGTLVTNVTAPITSQIQLQLSYTDS